MVDIQFVGELVPATNHLWRMALAIMTHKEMYYLLN